MSHAPREYRLDRSVGIEVVRLTEGAAVAAALEMGHGDEPTAFSRAVDGFLHSLGEVSLSVRVVMGEVLPGEERLSDGVELGEDGLRVDLAIKPVECLTACALGGRNAMSVVVVAPLGTIRPIPPIYMEKVAGGAELREVVEADLPPEELFPAAAAAKGVPVEELVVTMLDRPRNRKWLEAARAAGCRVTLIADGDVAGAIATAVPESGIDLLVGSGGAREGWLAAAALRGFGGAFRGRFLVRTSVERQLVLEAGFEDPNANLGFAELLPEELIFSATAITDGEVLRGVRFRSGVAVSESLMVRSASATVRWIRTARKRERATA